MDLGHVKAHYSGLRALQGAQAMGWNSTEAQDARLRALAVLVAQEKDYTLNDWGCGELRALKFFRPSYYYGYDLIAAGDDMIVSDVPTHQADYTIASGIFNVKGDKANKAWSEYIFNCIRIMSEKSRRGFGFNMLPTRCIKKPDLYYYDPYMMVGRCRKYGRVSLLQHYSEFDFTILVQKC